jgi:predicted transposase/invertase (TIGR01784 family)
MSQWKDRYLSEYTFREKFTNELLAETIVIIFAELARFKKSVSECTTPQDVMMYVLKNMRFMHKVPQWLDDEMYDRLFNACEIAGFTEDKLLAYESDMNDEKRLKGEYSAYQRLGMELGLKQGLEQGLKQGREQGLEQGLEEGREAGIFEGKAEIVRQMYYNGMKKEHIEQMTGIPISEIDRMLAK